MASTTSLPEQASPIPMLTSPPPPAQPASAGGLPVFSGSAPRASLAGFGAAAGSGPHPALVSQYYQMMADKLWGAGLISPPGSDSSQHSDKSANNGLTSANSSTNNGQGKTENNFSCKHDFVKYFSHLRELSSFGSHHFRSLTSSGYFSFFCERTCVMDILLQETISCDDDHK